MGIFSVNPQNQRRKIRNSITYLFTCYRCVVEVVVEHDVEAEPEGQDEEDVPQQEEEERRQHLNGRVHNTLLPPLSRVRIWKDQASDLHSFYLSQLKKESNT